MDEKLIPRVEREAGDTVITFAPTLNDCRWGDIEQIGQLLLHKLDEDHATRLVIDVSRLHSMGSALVALIVRLWKAVKERDGRLALVCQDDVVIETVQVAGLAAVWAIVDSREAAHAALQQPATRVDYTKALIALASLVVTALSIASLFLIEHQAYQVSPQVLFLAGYLLLAAGLIGGTLTAVRGTGVWRRAGIAIVVVNLLAGAASVVEFWGVSPAASGDAEADEQPGGASGLPAGSAREGHGQGRAPGHVPPVSVSNP